jgi:hypothetical protein
MDVDLERGRTGSPTGDVSPRTVKTEPTVDADADTLEPLRSFRRPFVPRRASLDIKVLTQPFTQTFSQRGGKSPVRTSVSEHSEDGELITKCDCPDRKTLRLLPFLLPSELGLSKPSRSNYLSYNLKLTRDFYIIEALKETPSTPHTIIDPDYVLLDRAVDDELDGSQPFIARQLENNEMERMCEPTKKARDATEHWKFINYGSPKLDYHGAQICPKHLLESPVIINESLIFDLQKTLFPQPLPDTGVNDVFIDWLVPHTKMQLYALIYFGAGFRQYFPGWFYPESYIIADYIALLQFIRKPHVQKQQEHEDWITQFREFQIDRLDFWKEKLGLSQLITLLTL